MCSKEDHPVCILEEGVGICPYPHLHDFGITVKGDETKSRKQYLHACTENSVVSRSVKGRCMDHLSQ